MELAPPPDLLRLERPVTVDELMGLPEGPPYFELFDGEVIEVPPPSKQHALISRALFRILDGACPAGMEVLYAPVGWRASAHELYEPDLLVLRTEAMAAGEGLIEAPPELCVEILSPGSRRHDLIRKRRAYERAGVRSYWVLDPEPPGGGPSPRLTVLELELELTGGCYTQMAQAEGDQRVELARPFPVLIVPAELTAI